MDRGIDFNWRRVVGILGLLIVCLVATPHAAAQRTVYTTATAGSVSALEVLPSGALGPIPGSPYPTGSGSNAVAATPDGRHLYVTNQFSNNISAFAIGQDGALSPVPGSPFAADGAPGALAAAPDGRHLYAGNQASNTISVYEIGAAGALTPISGSPFAVGFQPYALALAPDGRNLYAGSATIASPGVHGFAVAADASLTELPGSPYELPPFFGIQVLAVTVTPDGRNLYTGNGNNDVVGFRRAADGELTVVPGSPYEATFWGIAASPDGRYVYTADRFANDEISGFAIEGDGSLTDLPGSPYAVTPSPSRPVALAISPDSRHIYASSGAPFEQDYAFSIAADGSLAPLAGSPFGAGAQADSHSIAISPNQGPTAEFTASVAPSGQTAFDGAASSDPDGTITRYDWDFGDGTTLADGGPTPTHTYRDAGAYQAVLTVTDNEGCSTTVVYTGQTASCNGSGRAQRTDAVRFDPAPVITKLRVKPKSFAADGRPTALNKKGARIAVRLSEDAKVRFRVRRRPARTGDGRPKHPHVFKRRLAAGANSVPFTGTLGKRTFKPGRYQVIARARDAAKQPSERVRAKFKIKR